MLWRPPGTTTSALRQVRAISDMPLMWSLSQCVTRPSRTSVTGLSPIEDPAWPNVRAITWIKKVLYREVRKLWVREVGLTIHDACDLRCERVRRYIENDPLPVLESCPGPFFRRRDGHSHRSRIGALS